MFSLDDTIVALATPPGRGGLAVVRLSGRLAVPVAGKLVAGSPRLEPRRATLVQVIAGAGPTPETGGRPDVVDEAIVTLFESPASYTGEDVVEFSVHGSPVVVGEIVSAAVAAGARLARGGEFTLRAFLNGRLDLTRAEAVRDLVEATTPAQARMAMDQLQGTLAERIGEIEAALFNLTARLEASGDFPEEGYHFISPEETLAAIRGARARMDALVAESRRGRLLREGVTVAIAGRPNVGKSTLFNRLTGVERAIVTAVPGTTRDLLIEAVMLWGVRTTLVDTAGIGATADPVEREGVVRAEKAIAAADVVVVVLDASLPPTAADRGLLEATAARARVVVLNKSDLALAWEPAQLPNPSVGVSAKTGRGIGELIRAIAIAAGVSGPEELPHISNARQIELLGRSTEVLSRLEDALASLGSKVPEELVLADLRLAVDFLQEVTGKRTTDDLLDTIFSTFCVGK
jgi:tRNA modification GTPase